MFGPYSRISEGRMPLLLPHKLMALGMVCLLLLQYAPAVQLWNPQTHKAGCTHCNGSYCPLEAKGHDAGDHQHAMQSVHTGHRDALTAQTAGPHAGPKYCSCDHGGGPGLFLIVLDKVVVAEARQASRSLSLLSHPVLMEVVKLDGFATDLFRPPRTHL